MQAQNSDPAFQAWMDGLRQEALGRGIPAGLLDRVLSGVTPIERVIELDNRQPEFTQTFWGYLDKRVSETRIAKGREMLAKHGSQLKRIAARYGVQPRFLVAFWGMETNYGGYTGKMPVIGSLVTLAYNPRRGAFFREQLLTALELMARGDLAEDAKGSWAGAIGNVQFIPTTFKAYAVDGDGDGKRDHFGSFADIFASASNYLAQSGWDPQRTWGREVRLPKGFDLDLAGLGTKKRIADWQRLGIRRFDGRDLPAVDIDASLVMPAGIKGPAFLVYQNFRTIMIWNRSISYALAVGHLADRLVGGGPFLTARVEERPLSRQNVIEIQRLLTVMGFDPGGVDGIMGSGTRKAVRAFQRSSGRPADGHADISLLAALRAKAGG
ncbi:MAG: lytic murein transglycosylase [Magnetovibrionaceae bacterium]